MATLGRVASSALVDQLNGHPTPPGSVGTVMLIGVVLVRKAER